MNSGQTLFSQLAGQIPLHQFRKCVSNYHGNHRTRRFSCLDQFLCMAFAQLTYRESLRDIVACLRSHDRELYHMGIRGRVSRSTLADANESRDWRIYADLAQVLIGEARQLYAKDKFRVDLDHITYAIDSTTIDLCMSLFPWASYKTTQNAMKLHTQMDLRGNIPTFIRITPAKMHDVRFLDEITPEPGAFYLIDRGYLDFARLYRWTTSGAFFVTRSKKNLRFKRIQSRPVDKTSGVRRDQTISLKWFYAAKGHPSALRRIRYWDQQHRKTLVFLTNNFTLPPLVIAELYRSRWQIELFFKWIKQHLRIKAFYGTSENAVKTQIWIAISVYVLVAIARKRWGIKASPYTILQTLSVSIFDKTPIKEAFAGENATAHGDLPSKQLVLWDF